MATLAALVEDVKEVVYGVARVERPDEDTIDGALTDSATTMTVDTEVLWSRGDYAEFADGEIVIFAANASGATAIRRGQLGSTAAAQADGAVIRKNPWPLRITIERTINEVALNDLWPHVWSWHQGTVTYTTDDHLYDLPQYIEEVVAVEQANVDSDGKFRPLSPAHWDVERQIHTDIATNELLLRLRDPFDVDTDVYYRGKRRPHPDDLANLDSQLEPLVVWGAAAKLMAGGVGGSLQDTARIGREDSGRHRNAYQLLMSEFLRMRDSYHRQLMGEVRVEPRFRPMFRRSW